jgi:hypothetical protein
MQTNNATKSNMIIGEDILEILKEIDEDRIMKQSEILDYSDLPGTFWVMAEPEIVTLGYIFLDMNYIMIVQVDKIQNDQLLEFGLAPTLMISKIRRVEPYDIINNKIIMNENVFGYLEDTFLYFNMGREYKKHQLWDWFVVTNKQGELINPEIYW